MATIERLEGGRWRARWRTPDGKSREQRFDRKLDAERFLTSVEHRKLAGEYVDPSAGRVTLEVYSELWRARQVHRPSTEEQVESNLRRHVYPQLGDRPIGAVRPSEIQSWVKARSLVLAPGTVELIYRYLSAIFRTAVDDRLISRSPCSRAIKLPKKERAQVVPLPRKVVRQLVAEMPPRYRALITLGAGSGLRQGEAFGLTVDRVDFLRRTLTVDRQLVLVRGRPPEFGPPKTEASYRTVPLPSAVTDALSLHLATYGPGPDGLIFTNDAGKPIRRTRWSTIWRPAATAAGVPAGDGFHALRHFYASALIGQGCSVTVVQQALGHATASETLDTYSHLWPEDDDRVRRAIEAILSDVEDLEGLAEGTGPAN